MDLKGSRTEKNLRAALAGESQARNLYVFFTEQARKADLPLIADVFLEIAQNEKSTPGTFFNSWGAPRTRPRTWKPPPGKNMKSIPSSIRNSPGRQERKALRPLPSVSKR